MSPGVFAAVLVAALMHAGWNATLKVKLDPLAAMTLVTVGSGVLALPFLFVFGVPRAESWPWLLASVALHLAYYFTLSEAYRRADMGQVYPIARGGAPLLTTLGGLLVLREPLPPAALAGIAVLGGGVMLMALGGRTARLDVRALGYAALTALVISGYTLSDGSGARAAGDPHAYSAALFVINAVPLPAILAARHGTAYLRPLLAHPGIALGGGGMSLAAYSIAIWAMTVAPVALVAALRETSVLFAAVIATTVLREPWRPVRIAASVLILLGLAATRLG